MVDIKEDIQHNYVNAHANTADKKQFVYNCVIINVIVHLDNVAAPVTTATAIGWEVIEPPANIYIYNHTF
jgi:hypothetical protein